MTDNAAALKAESKASGGCCLDARRRGDVLGSEVFKLRIESMIASCFEEVESVCSCWLRGCGMDVGDAQGFVRCDHAEPLSAAGSRTNGQVEIRTVTTTCQTARRKCLQDVQV